MEVKIPKLLKKCPIIDVVVEIRFETKIDRNAVFGVIYNSLKKYQGKVSQIQMPLPLMPLPQNGNFNPMFNITNKDHTIKIGPNVLIVGIAFPYMGWSKFAAISEEIFNIALGTGIIGSVSRLGLRYRNFFEGDITNNLTFSLSNFKHKPQNLNIRFEVDEDHVNSVLQYANNAVLEDKTNQFKKLGSIIDIDCYRNYSSNFNFRANLERELKMVHDAEKNVFFSLLKESFLNTFEPEYE